MLAAPVDQTTTDDRAGLLDRYCGEDGKEWIYVQANGAIAQYDAVGIDEAGQAAPVTKAMLDDSWKVGVAQVAFADNEYGYVQIRGVAEVNVLASCAADAILYSSATAGSLDDTSTSQTKVAGIIGTETAGTAAENVACLMAIEPFADR